MTSCGYTVLHLYEDYKLNAVLQMYAAQLRINYNNIIWFDIMYMFYLCY